MTTNFDEAIDAALKGIDLCKKLQADNERLRVVLTGSIATGEAAVEALDALHKQYALLQAERDTTRSERDQHQARCNELAAWISTVQCALGDEGRAGLRIVATMMHQLGRASNGQQLSTMLDALEAPIPEGP